MLVKKKKLLPLCEKLWAGGSIPRMKTSVTATEMNFDIGAVAASVAHNGTINGIQNDRMYLQAQYIAMPPISNKRKVYLASFSQIMEKEIFVRLRAERANEVQNAMAHLQAADGRGGGPLMLCRSRLQRYLSGAFIFYHRVRRQWQ